MGNRDYVEGITASSLFYTAPFLILLGFMVYLLFILDWKEGQGNSYARLSVMMALFLLVAIHFRFVPKLPIHFVRFRIYVGYIVLLPCLYFLRKKHFELTRVDSMVLIILVMLIPWFNTTRKATDIQGYPNNMALLVHGVPDVDIHIPKVDGRVLCVSTTAGNLQFQARTLSHLIPIKTGNIACVGLFVESAANGPYIQGIQRLIDPESFNWAVYPIGEGLNLGYYLKLFNINYVLSLKDLQKYGFQLADMNVNQSNIVPIDFPHQYKLYKGPQSNLIEVLDYTPRVISSNWRQEVIKWWLSTSEIKHVLVYSKSPLPQKVGSAKERICILEKSRTWDKIRFKVEADEEVPILVKISEFPNWSAYVNGRKTHIYRASPYLMLIYGHGVIEMKYENRWYNWMGISVSLLGIVWLLSGLIKRGYPGARCES